MVLFDLALALGGMTVQELKQRMTLEELNGWAKYIDINGPLSPILRNDAAVARLSMVMAGKGAKMENFMPWPKRPEPEMDQMNVFKKLQALAAHNRTH